MDAWLAAAPIRPGPGARRGARPRQPPVVRRPGRRPVRQPPGGPRRVVREATRPTTAAHAGGTPLRAGRRGRLAASGPDRAPGQPGGAARAPAVGHAAGAERRAPCRGCASSSAGRARSWSRAARGPIASCTATSPSLRAAGAPPAGPLRGHRAGPARASSARRPRRRRARRAAPAWTSARCPSGSGHGHAVLTWTSPDDRRRAGRAAAHDVTDSLEPSDLVLAADVAVLDYSSRAVRLGAHRQADGVPRPRPRALARAPRDRVRVGRDSAWAVDPHARRPGGAAARTGAGWLRPTPTPSPTFNTRFNALNDGGATARALQGFVSP